MAFAKHGPKNFFVKFGICTSVSKSSCTKTSNRSIFTKCELIDQAILAKLKWFIKLAIKASGSKNKWKNILPEKILKETNALFKEDLKKLHYE